MKTNKEIAKEIARWSEIYTDENNKTEIRSAQSIKDFFKTL